MVIILNSYIVFRKAGRCASAHRRLCELLWKDNVSTPPRGIGPLSTSNTSSRPLCTPNIPLHAPEKFLSAQTIHPSTRTRSRTRQQHPACATRLGRLSRAPSQHRANPSQTWLTRHKLKRSSTVLARVSASLDRAAYYVGTPQEPGALRAGGPRWCPVVRARCGDLLGRLVSAGCLGASDASDLRGQNCQLAVNATTNPVHTRSWRIVLFWKDAVGARSERVRCRLCARYCYKGEMCAWCGVGLVGGLCVWGM